ncbi:stage II sporulation protein R [Bacillus sp. M6-12]|uniref:stage II sporulation protein R n=1 Tax=Bacillus sp. M6-12 TaxID=2054166 RepID=UPI000C7801DD|nr:stage II sporulation protein R [Bacillus sp. M6-12]PLS18351.1 stage II sporulation protein R [Bacillus sp. M6-12]
MNKKYIPLAYLLILTIGTILSLYMPKQETASAEETLVIPKEAIRLRILANSDKQKDQDIKRLIRDEVNADISEWVKDLTSLDDARNVIESHLPDIQKTAEQVVHENGVSQTVKVDFGRASFPTKLYGQYLYPAGEYEAIVITLGEGEGANWWCVLFPPLCFLDFSNGTAVSQSPMNDEQPVSEKELQTEVAPAAEKSSETQLPEASVAVEENDKSISKHEKKEQVVAQAQEPVYVEQDEQPIKAKFLILELFEDIF